jgi:PAS domain S-box-containing protein
MDENEKTEIDLLEDVERFVETYASFNKIINKIQRQYLTLKETYALQSEQLQAVNRTLQSLVARNGAVTEFLNSILDSIPSGVIAVDKTGWVNLINPAARRILRISAPAPEKEKLYYKDLFKEIGETDFTVLKAISDGHSFRSQKRAIKFENGETTILEVSASPIKNSEGEIVGGLELLSDVTELRNMEEQISRMKLLASLGEMAAGIAHEIRNPLGGIGGFAALLARDLEGDEAKRKMAEKIVDGVESINRTIETLLDFARNEEIHKTRIGVKEYLNTLLDRYMEEYGHSCDSKILRYIDIDENIKVDLDAQLFKQALFNLIKNGLEAGFPESKVAVGCRLLQKRDPHGLAGQGNHVEIWVKDDGKGIAKADLGRIFSPFYSTKQNGTGLGLSIAWKIINAHGGEIKAESETARGTKFSIYLSVGTDSIGGHI